MSWSALALLIATSAYAGFQLTVRVLVYPQFSAVGPNEFRVYEAGHQRRITIVVGPLFAALVVSTLAVVIAPPHRTPAWALAGIVVLLGTVLAVTGLLAVPLHARLSEGYDELTHRRLLGVDSIRLGAAVLDTALAAYLVSR